MTGHLNLGRIPLSHPRQYCLHNIVSECWTVVTTADASLELDDSFSIRGDPSRLRHVLENLFGNSIQHGDTDVTVRVGRLESDDGTGFGLTIVETIAHSHGWKVTVTESSDGGGRFEFRNVEFVG